MSERITVAVRVRPFLRHEDRAACVAVAENHVVVGEARTFAFDHVFDGKASSGDVYVTLGQPLADAFLSGFHASTIAYGQTGAGKTFTMAALLHDTVQEIFCRLSEESASESSVGPTVSSPASPAEGGFRMSLSVLEVYNEAVNDLLAPAAPASCRSATPGPGGRSRQPSRSRYASQPRRRPSLPPCSGRAQDRRSSNQYPAPSATSASAGSGLSLREDPNGGVFVVGLTEAPVHTETELIALIDGAIGNRKTASTLMNATSSRSHCVLTLTLQRRGLCSRCCFVDLAGSERLKKSLGVAGSSERAGGEAGAAEAALLPAGTAATRMREGININSGLLALGNVIVALCDKKSHVPYRSSKLTRLLQPMLGGNSRTAMVACVAPHSSSLEETLNTLKYADRAKHIHIDPHIGIAAANTTADAAQTITFLREQLEEAQQRLTSVSTVPRPGDGASASANTAALAAEVASLRALLQRERRLTQRLESDLFNAEYNTMVEAERRKELEARVAELEAAAASRSTAGESSSSPNESGDGDSVGSAAAGPTPRTQNLARLEKLEVEREALTAMRAQKARDSALLEAALVVTDGPTVKKLTEEIAAKEALIAQLQKENGDVSAQLSHYEKELQRTVTDQETLRAELLEAETRLEQSEMAREQREQEKAKLHATYEERLKRAEEKAAEYRRRVKEATQRVRERQEDLDRTRQLQETVTGLREELTRQRQRARTTQKTAEQLTAAHQQEVAQLQRQLQHTSAQMALLQQQVERKEAAIARTRKRLASQQTPTLTQPPSQLLMTQPPSQTQMTPPPSQPPLSQRTASAAAGARTPSPGLDGAATRSSPPAVLQRRRDRRRVSGGASALRAADGAGPQAAVVEALAELGQMGRELAELQEYRRVLLSAQTTDAPKWHRAREGFRRRLSEVRTELQTTTPDDGKRPVLEQERRDMEEKLQQLETFHHMFADADQQLAEFDNRIVSLQEARKFHLQRVRQLQRVTAGPGREAKPASAAVPRSNRTSAAVSAVAATK